VATLEPVTGPGNVRASVTLDYDQTTAEETKETFDPTQSVALTMQRTEQTAGSRPVAAGVPGTASNAPNSQAVPVYPHESTPPESAKTESDTYGVSKTVRHTVEGPGRIRRMTAAIVVNDRMAQPAQGSKPATWQGRPAEEMNHLTALAQASVGFDKARGDSLTVEDLPFDDNRPQPAVSMPVRVLRTAESSPVLIKYAALLMCVLVLTAFGVRPALRHAQMAAPAHVARRELSAAAAAQAALPAVEPPEPDPERMRSQEIFEQVTGHVKREPAQSSRLLQSWIHTE
jgi:flagellar M-ring protein FliF